MELYMEWNGGEWRLHMEVNGAWSTVSVLKSPFPFLACEQEDFLLR